MTEESIIVDWENVPGISGSEMNVRMKIIDKELMDVGWVKNNDWLDEVEADGVSTYTGKGYVDYVLFDDSHHPLAVIEAKRVTRDAVEGRKQAKEYAEALNSVYGRMPVVFLHNGYERIIIDRFGERRIHGLYSKEDLLKYFALQKSSIKALSSANIDTGIVDRKCGQSSAPAFREGQQDGPRSHGNRNG